MDSSFDGASIQLLQIANQTIGRFGKVSMVPYSKGIETKSARVRFEPSK